MNMICGASCFSVDNMGVASTWEGDRRAGVKVVFMNMTVVIGCYSLNIVHMSSGIRIKAREPFKAVDVSAVIGGYSLVIMGMTIGHNKHLFKLISYGIIFRL
jgi:hypothetical protein